MRNPYVFLVGCSRSGTTLLQRVVDGHPEIAITHECHWIAKWFEQRRGITPEGLVTPELIPRVLKHPWFARAQIGRRDLERLMAPGQPMTYSRFVTGIFDLYGEARGKALVGDRSPRYVRRIQTLHALWPEARFTHLIRDGRDVCLSMMNWRRSSLRAPQAFASWKDDPVSTAALWWELNVRLGRQAASWLGPKLYYEVRYESLVNHPAEECAALCSFLDLPYDDVMLRFHEDRTKADPDLDAKHPRLPITPGLRDWRSQMPAEDQERFEAAAGALLDELGYPRAFSASRPETREHAWRIRGLLAREPNIRYHLQSWKKTPGGFATADARLQLWSESGEGAPTLASQDTLGGDG